MLLPGGIAGANPGDQLLVSRVQMVPESGPWSHRSPGYLEGASEALVDYIPQQ